MFVMFIFNINLQVGLTLGIIGTSLAVLGANGNGFLNFGGRASEKDAEIAELKSMRYTDQIGIDLYKSIVEKSNVEDAKISALHDEVIRYVIDLEKRTGWNKMRKMHNLPFFIFSFFVPWNNLLYL